MYEQYYHQEDFEEESVIEDEELTQLISLTDDPKAFIECVLQIQDKLGHIVALEMNDAQLELFTEFKRQWDNEQPVRIIILKARQLGFSTIVAAMFYYIIATTPNYKAIIVAHKAEASTNIFNKTKLFYECSPEYLRPMRKASNAKEILFENPTTNENIKRKDPGLRSAIKIETAVNKDALRSDTAQLGHLSEFAFWPYPEDAKSAISAAIPLSARTAVIIESTANGIGNAFHEEWCKAECGESEFTPLFFPWFKAKEYTMPVPDDFIITDEEKEIKEVYSLSDEQIVWRRWCIKANCGGSIDKFKQEFPSNPREAFLASGRPVFNLPYIEAGLKHACEPLKVGRIIEDEKGHVVFRSEYNGYLKIWKLPEEGHSYILGIDTAMGFAKGDYSVIEVLDRKTKEFVAEWHGHIEPYLLGREAAYLGRFYNLGLIIPELNNTGISTVEELRRLRYPRIYRRRTNPDDVKTAPIMTYGFFTSSKSKPRIIDTLAEFINEYVGFGKDKIKSKALLDELMTYVYEDNGSTNAQANCHDDRVMAAGLALFALKENPNFEEVFYPIEITDMYEGVSSVTGY